MRTERETNALLSLLGLNSVDIAAAVNAHRTDVSKELHLRRHNRALRQKIADHVAEQARKFVLADHGQPTT